MSSQTKCVVMPKPNHKPKGETAMSANHTAVNEYRNLPISVLVESATNPRRRFNEDNLRELAESFQSQGILAPLLVRELEEQQIRGHRRGAPLACRQTRRPRFRPGARGRTDRCPGHRSPGGRKPATRGHSPAGGGARLAFALQLGLA